MKQPNFMTCSGEAGWWPEKINSLRPVASFNWSESERAPSPAEKKDLGPLYWIRTDHSENKYLLFWGNTDYPEWRTWFISLAQAEKKNFTESMFRECDIYDKAAAV